MTKILIDRSVVEQVLKALNTGMPIHKRSPTYMALKSALDAKPPSHHTLFDGSDAHLLNDAGDGWESDAKPNQVEYHQIKTEDDLVQRLRSRRILTGDYGSALDQAAARIEELTQKAQADASDWSRFHHLMKKYGLHPGRTGDDLIEILDRDMDASKVGLHHIRENNVKLRERITELEKSLDAAKWALDIASDNTGYQSESDREVNHEINSARKKIDEIRKASLGVAP